MAGAGNKKAVLEIYTDRFKPSSWSGSLAAILKERLPLLAKLNPTNDETLVSIIAHAQEALTAKIAYWEAWEEATERGETGSFE